VRRIEARKKLPCQCGCVIGAKQIADGGEEKGREGKGKGREGKGREAKVSVREIVSE
jgi:hypothetical protein